MEEGGVGGWGGGLFDHVMGMRAHYRAIPVVRAVGMGNGYAFRALWRRWSALSVVGLISHQTLVAIRLH